MWPGSECYTHEVQRLRLACAQILCLMDVIAAEFWTCREKQTSDFDCSAYIVRSFPLDQNIDCPPCGITRLGRLAELASGIPEQLMTSECFALKDIDARMLAFQVGMPAEVVVRKMMDHTRSLLFHIASLARHLGLLRWVQCKGPPLHSFSPTAVAACRSFGGSFRWPRFRLPPWDLGFQSPAPVLAKLVMLLLQGRGWQRLGDVQEQQRPGQVDGNVENGGKSSELSSQHGLVVVESGIIMIVHLYSWLHSLGAVRSIEWNSAHPRFSSGRPRRRSRPAAGPLWPPCTSWTPGTPTRS